MKVEVRALLMSFAFHTFLLLLIIIFSKVTFNAHKLVVIDLTLMDPVVAKAGASNDKRTSAAYKPKKKQQKAVSEDVNPVIEQKSEEIKDKKAETAPKVKKHNEDTKPDEQKVKVETVPIVQDGEQNPKSEDHEVSGRAGTFLTKAGDSTESSTSEKGEIADNTGHGFAGGPGNAGDASKLGYLKANFTYIKDLIQRNIRYPNSARLKGWEGNVEVTFIISSDGSVKEIKILKSSGFEILDKNTIEAVKNASPFPKPPVEAQIIIPIVYKLN
jgi:protein TonB